MKSPRSSFYASKKHPDEMHTESRKKNIQTYSSALLND